jgi:hypothetical protein
MRNRRESKVLRTVLCCALLLALARESGWSQINSTTISGAVTDAGGASVPESAISLVNQGTNLVITTKSNADGTFVLAGLAIGVYTITVTKDGFETYTQRNIETHPAQVTSVNPVMAVGAVTTHLEVTASAVQVQTSTPEVVSQVSGEQVGLLPLNGRNFQSLSALMPGVTNTAPDTAQVQGGFLQTNTMSVNGMGTNGTQYYVDGIWDMNTGDMNQLDITPNPDTIEEVRVLQNNFSAKYSLFGSNVALVQTKSGTDTFHGTAFEYFRNDALDARNYFSPIVPPLKQNIFGYTIGGPLFIPGHKKRTFFFWSQQWSKQHIGSALLGADPTEDMRNGTFNTPITDPVTGQLFPQTSPGIYQIPQGRINTNAVTFLNAFAPLPNNPSGGFLNYINLNPQINSTRDDEIKVDHNFNEKYRLMGEYLTDDQDNENPADNFLSSPYTPSRYASTSHMTLAQAQFTQVLSSSMVNTTSLTMNIYLVNLLVRGLSLQSQLPDFQQQLPYQGYLSDRLPQVNFGGGWSPIGVSTDLPSPRITNLINTVLDDWSWLKGNHYLQAGGSLTYGTFRQNSFSASNGQWFFSGQFTGNPIADYMLGEGATFYQASDVHRAYNHNKLFSPYIEDRWKTTRRLTITAGIRYEFLSPPTLQKEFGTNFLPSKYNPANAPIVNPDGTLTATPTYDPNNGLVFNGVNGVPLSFVNAHQNFWGPTGGFAYDFFGDGKTSLRGGAGITYTAVWTGTDCVLTCLGNPPLIPAINLVSPSFPSPAGAGAAPLGAASLYAMNPNFNPSTQVITYSLSTEHQFGQNWILTITGAGNATRHANGFLNINQPPPDAPYDFNPLINTGTVFPYVYSPYLGYGSITQSANPIKQRWNALEVNLRHPVGHNVMFTSAYTWQHCLSNAPGLSIVGGAPMQDSYHPLRNYGTCSFNAFNVWTTSLVWSPTWFQKSKPLERLILSGWQLSDISTIQSGFALNPGLVTSNPGLATVPDRVPGLQVSGPKTAGQWFNTAAFSSPAPGYFGDAKQGSITGPGVVNFDLAMYKDFHIKEHQVVQFRGELFNAFNITNFSGVQTAYGAGNFGQVTSALDPRIAELVLRYQF